MKENIAIHNTLKGSHIPSNSKIISTHYI